MSRKNVEAESQFSLKEQEDLETLKELKQFLVDICFDYTCKDPGCSADIGLSAIRVLCKGKQREEEFKKTRERWREKQIPVHNMLGSSDECLVCKDRDS
ncbi:hypothetical protein LCGC14_3108980 [marine sediment metagenome]|uniref:Uncharacterized protein n=1 Tax=marine sediment metagenome TaxID=412755 RepID=A0A0F8YVJ8_9ZZZZ